MVFSLFTVLLAAFTTVDGLVAVALACGIRLTGVDCCTDGEQVDIIEVLRPSLDLAVLLAIVCDDEAEVKGRFDLGWLTNVVPPFDRVGVNGC